MSATMSTKRELCTYDLGEYSRYIPREYVGRLVEAFNRRFCTWTLFPWFYCSNDRRNEYNLLVVKSQTSCKGDDDFFDQGEKEMYSFVKGFAAGIKGEVQKAEEDGRRYR